MTTTARLALRYDAKLTHVTHALHRFTFARESNALTSGARDAFPLPGLRLCGDADDTHKATELLLPVTAHAVNAIVQHPHSIHTNGDVNEAQLVWEIAGSFVELRNRRWHAFVDTIVRAVRAPLGILEAADVDAALHKLVLVRCGGRLPLHHNSTKRGVFGTLVVVLPGEFVGGEVTVKDSADSKALASYRSWRPRGADHSVYGVHYAAYYHNATDVETAPVTSGDAVCLMYELSTTTVHEVPRFAGHAALTHALHESLSAYFDVFPRATKRLKISDDAWRTIHEFSVDHRLVVPVTGDAFDKLRGNDNETAERLAAFCAHSGGQYDLFLTSLSGMRTVYSREAEDDNRRARFAVSLQAPWLKHGDTRKLPFMSTNVRHLNELAPAGFLEHVEYERDDDLEQDSDDDDDLYGYDGDEYHEEHYCKSRQYQGHALVVQPATLELSLWAKLPLQDVVNRLDELVPSSRRAASRLVRLALATKPRWTNTKDTFTQFLRVVTTLNDASLFSELLQSVRSFNFEETAVAQAVHHFGWDPCVATIERIIQTASVRSRVNLICSLLHGTSLSEHTHSLILQLTRLDPWTSQPAGRLPVLPHHTLSVHELSRFFSLAYRSSLGTLCSVLDKPVSEGMYVHLIVPSLLHFVEGLWDAERSPLLPKLQEIRDNLETSLPTFRNLFYASRRIPEHCDKCRELKAFVSSTSTQTVLAIKDKAQLKHVETVIKRNLGVPSMRVELTAPKTLLLTKLSTRSTESDATERWLARLSVLLVDTA